MLLSVDNSVSAVMLSGAFVTCIMSCAIYSLHIYFVVSVFHDFIHFSVN